MDNIFSIVVPPSGLPDVRWNKIPSQEALGDFELLIDEDLIHLHENENNSYLLKNHRWK